jgi:hypothetical protein
LNPRTLGPIASTITITPPRKTDDVSLLGFTSCWLVGRYQRIRKTYCIRFQDNPEGQGSMLPRDLGMWYKSRRRYNPEEQNRHLRHRENAESHLLLHSNDTLTYCVVTNYLPSDSVWWSPYSLRRKL